MDLRKALVNAGLVSEEKARAVEERKNNPSSPLPDHMYDGSGQSYKIPRGRKCKPLWAKWYQEKFAPPTADSLCCECGAPAKGRQGIRVELGFTVSFHVDPVVAKEVFGADREFRVCTACHHWILQGNR